MFSDNTLPADTGTSTSEKSRPAAVPEMEISPAALPAIARTGQTGLQDLLHSEYQALRKLFSDNNIEDAGQLIAKRKIDIEVEDLTIVSISMRNLSIHDISALKDLASLTRADFYGNSISDIEPLRGATKLVHCDLTKNRLVSLEPLAGCTALQSLNIGMNPGLETASLGSLRGLQKLREINLVNNSAITSLEALNDLPGLSYVKACGTRVNMTDPLVQRFRAINASNPYIYAEIHI